MGVSATTGTPISGAGVATNRVMFGDPGFVGPFGPVAPALRASAGTLATNVYAVGTDLNVFGGPASMPETRMELTLPAPTADFSADFSGFRFDNFTHTFGEGTLEVEANTGSGFNAVALVNSDINASSSGGFSFAGGLLTGVTGLRLTFVGDPLNDPLQFAASSLTATPEPTSVALFSVVMCSAIGFRRRRRTDEC